MIDSTEGRAFVLHMDLVPHILYGPLKENRKKGEWEPRNNILDPALRYFGYLNIYSRWFRPKLTVAFMTPQGIGSWLSFWISPKTN